jgi:carbonic anhydrase
MAARRRFGTRTDRPLQAAERAREFGAAWPPAQQRKRVFIPDTQPDSESRNAQDRNPITQSFGKCRSNLMQRESEHRATDRRGFFRLALGGCAACLSAGVAAAAPQSGHGGQGASSGPAHWSYAGDSGPAHWGELQPDFKVCQLGLEQTPIDLDGAIKGAPGSIAFDYKPLPLRILNNGHTIQVNAEAGCACTIAGTRYELSQFHFHHPSEHLLAGKPFDLECHFVHKSAAGALAVVGVFIRPGARNAALAPLFDAMPAKEGPELRAAGTIDPAALLPSSASYFRYMGSLTTPPCSEGLTWTVYREPIEASPEQIRQFATLFANNARPVQKRNRRFVIEAN